MDIKKLDGKSLDIEKVDMEKLKAVFPQVFMENKLDIDKLLNLCGQYIDNDFEKYKFEWKGKSNCYKIAGKRSTGTLRPAVQESIDFENTQNLYIEGDNLEVLKLLQNAYYRKVKMIYIDPPYNTGNDFVYEDDFKDPIAKYKEITEQTTKSNPETMGRYHTNWLNMMYPRLRLASNLLRDDGVIFISIDDNEVTNLRKLCDEVFGEENFVAQISWKRKKELSSDSKNIAIQSEYIMIYAKSNLFNIKLEKLSNEYIKSSYNEPTNDFPLGKWRPVPITVSKGLSGGGYNYSISTPAGIIHERLWAYPEHSYKKLLDENRIFFGKDKTGIPQRVIYAHESKGQTVSNCWDNVSTNKEGKKEILSIFNDNYFDTPKPTELIKKMIRISTEQDDIILDFFSGSATTAHAVMQLNAEDGGNRKFIMVQLPEKTDEKSEAFKAGYKNICEIGKERIRRAGSKIKEQNANVDTGFKVFKMDTSNLKKWDDTPIENDDVATLFDRMDDLEKTLKTDRSDLDYVYEVMLKLGIPLTYSISTLQLGTRKVYSIGEDSFVLVCLDNSNGGITADDITAMCDINPDKIVASEEAFSDDVALSNAYYISKDKDVKIELL